MIELITGLPGNGKTLYALAYVKAWSEKDNRPVYYSGINELKLPWTEIDPQKWFDCPPNSIILIDECQRVFRRRFNDKDIPDYVSRLETHRHQGLDIVLITQHPSLCDIAIRRLAGKHLHVMRKWGTQSATIHEWNSVKDNCDKNGARSDSIKHAWKYDKEIFSYYHSAEVHTVKRNIPFRVFFVYIVLPLVLLATFYYMWRFVDKRRNPSKYGESPAVVAQADQAKLTAPAGAPVPPGQSGTQKASYKNALEDAQQYVFERTERIQGLPHTAPRYDEVAKPIYVPRPAACVYSKKKCNCYSQQATLMAVPERLCHEIVDRGYFIDFDDGSNKVANNDKQTQQQPSQQSQPTVIRPDAVPIAVTEEADKKSLVKSTTSTMLPSRVVVVRKPA